MPSLKARIFLFSLLVINLVLSACQAAGSATPPPTLIPITLAYSPALRPWGNRAYECATRQNQIALYTHEIPDAELDPSRYELTLRLGSPGLFALSSAYTALIGWEPLVFIINQANPNTRLTTEQLRNLFSGTVKDWSTLGEKETRFERPVQIWSYAKGNELQQVLETSLLSPLRSYPAYLAPDPQAMLLAIPAEPGAIGYVPQSWLTVSDPDQSQEVQVVQMDEKLAESFRQPVIAFSTEEPKGAARALLVCLQSLTAP